MLRKIGLMTSWRRLKFLVLEGFLDFSSIFLFCFIVTSVIIRVDGVFVFLRGWECG